MLQFLINANTSVFIIQFYGNVNPKLQTVMNWPRIRTRIPCQTMQDYVSPWKRKVSSFHILSPLPCSERYNALKIWLHLFGRVQTTLLFYSWHVGWNWCAFLRSHRNLTELWNGRCSLTILVGYEIRVRLILGWPRWRWRRIEGLLRVKGNLHCRSSRFPFPMKSNADATRNGKKCSCCRRQNYNDWVHGQRVERTCEQQT